MTVQLDLRPIRKGKLEEGQRRDVQIRRSAGYGNAAVQAGRSWRDWRVRLAQNLANGKETQLRAASNWASSKGLRRKAQAPAAMAWCGSASGSAVTTITGKCTPRAWIRSWTSRPFSPGMVRSRSRQSGRWSGKVWRNSGAEAKVSAFSPRERSNRARALRTESSLSRSATRNGLLGTLFKTLLGNWPGAAKPARKG